MSSAYVGKKVLNTFEAEKAVDGVYEEEKSIESLAHSKHETRPWWRVDLGDVYCVWAVNILNRYESKLNCPMANNNNDNILYRFF